MSWFHPIWRLGPRWATACLHSFMSFLSGIWSLVCYQYSSIKEQFFSDCMNVKCIAEVISHISVEECQFALLVRHFFRKRTTSLQKEEAACFSFIQITTEMH